MYGNSNKISIFSAFSVIVYACILCQMPVPMPIRAALLGSEIQYAMCSRNSRCALKAHYHGDTLAVERGRYSEGCLCLASWSPARVYCRMQSSSWCPRIAVRSSFSASFVITYAYILCRVPIRATLLGSEMCDVMCSSGVLDAPRNVECCLCFTWSVQQRMCLSRSSPQMCLPACSRARGA